MLYTDYVNIKQGTKSVSRFSNGNTLPLVQCPFGMSAFALQTEDNLRWYYHPESRSIEGIRLTHQPSPWIGDWGAFLLGTFSGDIKTQSGTRWSGFRPEEAVLKPYYMKARFLRYRSDFELTPTERGAFVKVKFDNKDNAYLTFAGVEDNCYFEYKKDNNMLYAYTEMEHTGNAKNFKNYIVIKFADGIIDVDNIFIKRGNTVNKGFTVTGEDTGIFIGINNKNAEYKLASSFISFEQAELNLKQDFNNKNFDDIVTDTRNKWEEYLKKIEIEADEDMMKTFYSCMYRLFLYPHKCYEINEKGENIHYSPATGKCEKGFRYTDNGFWDTYRTVYPMFSIICPDEMKEMLEGFIGDYREGGWLPRWIAIGEHGCMPSTSIDTVICDAAVKGLIDGEILETGFKGMLHHSVTDSSDDNFGRSGAGDYCKFGYVPLETHKESVNLTLDAAYGDWCIAEIAKILENDKIENEYRKRALNYKNLFDCETGFMRAKDKNGNFRTEFSPTSWGLDYTEGSAWQNSFAVQHDIEGFAELCGGKDKLIAKIDELFNTPPVYEVTGYGCEIHEMTEMAAADFGQCAISNQPSFHLPYIYSALGDVDRTSERNKCLITAFSYKDDGFPGDEDNGSMACWYIFTVLGFYPFCPGKAEYVRSKMLCKKAKINGKNFNADNYKTNVIPYNDLK